MARFQDNPERGPVPSFVEAEKRTRTDQHFDMGAEVWGSTSWTTLQLESRGHPTAAMLQELDITSDSKKLEDSLSGDGKKESSKQESSREQGVGWAPSLQSSERLGVPRPAVRGTQQHSLQMTAQSEQCASLGGGKRGQPPEDVYEDDDSIAEQVTPVTCRIG